MKKEHNVYGYIRVSTKKQSVELQKKAISQYSHIDEWFEDTKTGTTINRDNFNRLVKFVETDLSEGNEVTIIFYSVSRMSRNAKEGIEQYFNWYDRGVNLVFLNEHHIDTDSYRKSQGVAIADIKTGDADTDDLINGILARVNKFIRAKAADDITKAFEQAEKEVRDLQKRTKDGMDAKGAGEKISKARKGQSFVTEDELRIKISALKDLKVFGGTDNQSKFAKVHGISRMTVYRYIQDIEQELTESTQEELSKKYRAELNEKKKQKADK